MAIEDIDLKLMKMVKTLEKEFKRRGLNDSADDLRAVRRKVIKGIVDAEISIRMVDLNKED